MLFGKWRDEDTFFPVRGFFLKEHIFECMYMANFILDVIPFGRMLYDVMALERFDVTLGQFKRLCYLAVFLHDMGKAGREFQRMIWEKEE